MIQASMRRAPNLVHAVRFDTPRKSDYLFADSSGNVSTCAWMSQVSIKQTGSSRRTAAAIRAPLLFSWTIYKESP